jgi:hypothetical protein
LDYSIRHHLKVEDIRIYLIEKLGNPKTYPLENLDGILDDSFADCRIVNPTTVLEKLNFLKITLDAYTLI